MIQNMYNETVLLIDLLKEHIEMEVEDLLDKSFTKTIIPPQLYLAPDVEQEYPE